MISLPCVSLSLHQIQMEMTDIFAGNSNPVSLWQSHGILNNFVIMTVWVVTNCISLKPPYLNSWFKNRSISVQWPEIQRESTCWALAPRVVFKVIQPNSCSRTCNKTLDPTFQRKLFEVCLNPVTKRWKTPQNQPLLANNYSQRGNKQDSNRLRNSHMHM